VLPQLFPFAFTYIRIHLAELEEIFRQRTRIGLSSRVSSSNCHGIVELFTDLRLNYLSASAREETEAEGPEHSLSASGLLDVEFPRLDVFSL
jgi:hypothetical protein